MSFVTVVVYLNMVGAFAAFIASTYAVRRGFKSRRAYHASVGALAIFYAGGYVWLLTHASEAQAWSEFYRGVALIVWPVVWVWPALRNVHEKNLAKQRLQELDDRLRDET